MTDRPRLPEYDRPPVIEVACGILFKELAALQAVHLGALWQKLKPVYSHSREVPPLAAIIEGFGTAGKARFQLTDIPPLPRTWLLTPKENGIVQVQRDRFLHNWKKVALEDEYPRYTHVIQMFRDRLQTFEEFLTENDLGAIEPLQYEMTYINHIPQGDGWNSLAQAGDIFPDFVRRKEPIRFLAEPDQLNWRTSFLLPNTQGRLHTIVRHIHRPSDSKSILLFELTARGFPNDDSRESMWTWFDVAHEWIVNGFTDLTSEQVRKDLWRQTR